MFRIVVLIQLVALLSNCNDINQSDEIFLKSSLEEVALFTKKTGHFPDYTEVQRLPSFIENANNIEIRPPCHIWSIYIRNEKRGNIYIRRNGKIFLFTCEKEFLKEDDEIAVFLYTEKKTSITGSSYYAPLDILFAFKKGKIERKIGRYRHTGGYCVKD